MSIALYTAFSEGVNKLNQKEVNLKKIDKFAELVLGSGIADSHVTRHAIAGQIVNPEVRATLCYLLGLTKIVPNIMTEEVKLKYSLLHTLEKPNASKINDVLCLQDGHQYKDCDRFNEVLYHFGASTSVEQEMIVKEFQKIKIVKLKNGDDRIHLLDLMLRAGDRWPLFADFLHRLSERTGLIKAKDLVWFFDFMWDIELLNQTLELMSKMYEEMDLYIFLSAADSMQYVKNRPEMTKTLLQLKKGMGELVDHLIPIFLEVPEKEWPEMVSASNFLAGEHFCDNFQMVKAIKTARAGERMEVATCVNQFVKDLQKEKIYGSEIGHLICAAGEIPQDKRYGVMTGLLQHYQNLKSQGKELNGVELAEEIRKNLIGVL